MKATAVAPSNIAFIKFFGKVDENLRLPANSSISMCLSASYTTTTVEFSPAFKKDVIYIQEEYFTKREDCRIIEHLERIRKMAKIHALAKVVTRNSFPKSSGIASSASGFAALTLAASAAAGLNLSERELSILSRFGSGSACRSIPSGFVEWKKGKNSLSSYAYSLYPPSFWDIRDILAIVSDKSKKTATTDAHKLGVVSPFYKERIKNIDKKIKAIKEALQKKDFTSFGEILEEEALNMHAVMMTAVPPLFYWTDRTVRAILSVWQWRRKGLPVYFTIDAGPNIHLICEQKFEKAVVSYIKKLSYIKRIIINKPAQGARLTYNHLF